MSNLFRQNVQDMAGYAPGEQPQGGDWVKLNTNENPYPPSPAVVDAIQQAATSRLNVYPDPLAMGFREAAAELFQVTPDWILPANGSDENLTILIRSFCEPGSQIVYPYPSYVLYETLAKIQDCRVERLLLDSDFQWEPQSAAAAAAKSAVAFVPNPNSPTGNRWTADQLAQLRPNDGVLVVDEAYGDFADTPHRGELLHDERFAGRTILTRTLSKSYSLAGIRFGFSVAAPELTVGMQKVKDSYNCDAVAIAAATAALQDQQWMLENRQKIIATRTRLAAALEPLGFQVFPSEANFLWTQHSTGQHQTIYEKLKERHVLVRYMTFPGATAEASLADGIRITVGTDEQIDRFCEAVAEVVGELS
ncbi:MAG: histidinol-phosphate transaminase [Planctomycetaceae bacterium]|nr:histidinol-phosphate transaminase [Planctomycetaceae bacterium]